jgi:malate dehydrogenase
MKHVEVIFNPADVTSLTALIHSGLKPNQLTHSPPSTLRLQQGPGLEFGVQQER